MIEFTFHARSLEGDFSCVWDSDNCHYLIEHDCNVVLYRYYLYIRKGETQMEQIQNTTIPPVGKTIIDEYIESLIQNTADGSQFWHTDMSGKCLRYY